jgi:hypothetical protein
VLPPIRQDCLTFLLQDLVLLSNHLPIYLGFGLIVERLVLAISSRKITALFQAISPVCPRTFEGSFQRGKARPISIPADRFRIARVA